MPNLKKSLGIKGLLKRKSPKFSLLRVEADMSDPEHVLAVKQISDFIYALQTNTPLPPIPKAIPKKPLRYSWEKWPSKKSRRKSGAH